MFYVFITMHYFYILYLWSLKLDLDLEYGWKYSLYFTVFK